VTGQEDSPYYGTREAERRVAIAPDSAKLLTKTRGITSTGKRGCSQRAAVNMPRGGERSLPCSKKNKGGCVPAVQPYEEVDSHLLSGGKTSKGNNHRSTRYLGAGVPEGEGGGYVGN